MFKEGSGGGGPLSLPRRLSPKASAWKVPSTACRVRQKQQKSQLGLAAGLNRVASAHLGERPRCLAAASRVSNISTAGDKSSHVAVVWNIARREAEGEGQCPMKQSELFRQSAENCRQMVEAARGEPAYNRYERMETAWLALAEEQDWLDDERSPVGPEDGLQALQLPLLERVVPRHPSVGR